MSLNTPVTDWTTQRIWVVGASSGIGLALAKTLVTLGARVAVSARRAEPLHALALASPQQVLALPLNMTENSDWDNAWSALKSAWQGVDWVVFCAADYTPIRAWELDRDRAAQLIDVNLTGTLRGVATVLPDFLTRGQGGIAIVASVAGYMGLPKSLVYGPTKAALINFAESLFLDVKPKGLDVCIINPGFVATPLTAQNDFDMPALMTPEAAALEIINGLARGDYEIHFPKRFTRMLRLIRRLPDRLRLAVLARIAKNS
jgi:short-subunit dehydrogenase